MAEPHCYGSLQVCALRVAKLDAAGSPDDGASNGYISDALIMARITTEVEEGDEFTLKNGCGAICQTFKDCDRVKRVPVEMELCQLDSELLSLLTNGSNIIEISTGDSIGYELPEADTACSNGVSLELWTKAWDGSYQATAPTFGGTTETWWHWVLPNVKFQIGDLTLENEILKVPVKGFGNENPRITADGPFDDWPSDIVARGGITSSAGWFLDDTLPTAECGFVNVPSAAS
jgi:hypothetical protein